MKVLIVGLPYFGKKIVAELIEFDPGNQYVFIATTGGYIEKLKYLFHLLSAQVVYSVSGTIRKGKVLRLALLMGKGIVMHWVGSDVMAAINDVAHNRVYNRYFGRVVNLCEVKWIQDELRHIGVNANIAQFANFPDNEIGVKPLPREFSILSYVGKSRELFYGIEKLIKLAIDFPEIKIKIAGIANYPKPLPSNIHLLGWVSDMAEQYRNCVLYLRLPEHDGLAFSVLEALYHGRYVGYSHDFEHVERLYDYSILKESVQRLHDSYNAGDLNANHIGREFITQNFGRTKVLTRLIEIFKSAACQCPNEKA